MKRSMEAPYSGFCCASVSLACIAVTRGDVSDGLAAAAWRRRGGGERRPGGGGERREPGGVGEAPRSRSNELGCRSLAFISARVMRQSSRSSSGCDPVPRPGYWIVPSSGATNLTCNK